MVRPIAWAACLCALACGARAGEAVQFQRAVTLADLYSAAEATRLARTLPADQAVNFHVRLPAGDGTPGALVFVNATDSGAFIDAWADTLDQRRLVWISADGFGNRRPSAQRVLVAMMARELLARIATVEAERVYLAGISGGGRIASQTITRFPGSFAGALYMVGADFHLPDGTARDLALRRPYVFLTGSRDFNRREMRRVSERYRASGAARVLFIDEPGFGHEPATPALLARALDFLDAR